MKKGERKKVKEVEAGREEEEKIKRQKERGDRERKQYICINSR